MPKLSFKTELNISDLAGIFIALIALMITLWQLNINRETFSSTIRPFLGIEAIEARVDNNKNFITIVQIKNFGQIPAKNIEINIDAYLNQQLIGKDKPITQGKATLFPNIDLKQFYSLQPYYDNIVNGEDSLTLIINLTYNGAYNSDYSSRYKFQYYKEGRVFAPISSEWF
jgi:hypothetical protein